MLKQFIHPFVNEPLTIKQCYINKQYYNNKQCYNNKQYTITIIIIITMYILFDHDIGMLKTPVFI